MSDLLKKITLSFLSALIIFFSFVPYLKVVRAADATWYNQDFSTWAGKVYDQNNPNDIFGERYTAAQVQWVIYGLLAFLFKSSPAGDLVICLLSNTDPTSCDTTNLTNQLKNIQDAANKEGYQDIQNQSLASLVFSPDRPISGIGYINNKLQNFSLVPAVHAQTSAGFGYVTALKPIQGFWGAIRNVAYGLFVLIAIVFAFMIMFRVKINPQTVISMQSAIPKIIIALILATFSYAISGFLIDLMYVVIGIFSVIFAGLFASTSPLVQALVNVPTTPTFYFTFMTNGILNTGILGTLAIGGIFFFLPIILILTIGGAAVVTSGFGGIIALVVIAVVLIIYLWIGVKTVWTLVKAFAVLLLSIIFSPLTLTLGAIIPNFSFGTWLKNIISQLSVFVTVGVLTTLSLLFGIESLTIIVQTFQQDWLKNIVGAIISILLPGVGSLISHATGLDSSTPGWPPLLGTGGGYAAAFMMWAVSFVLFTMIPKSAELIQSILSGKPFAYGSAIGEAFAPARMAWNAQPTRQFRDQLASAYLYSWLNNDNARRIGESLLGPDKYARIVGSLEQYGQLPKSKQNE